MKKLFFLVILIVGIFSGNAQTPEFSINPLNMVGVNTIDKDTLYLLDCEIGNMIKIGWFYITEEELMADGLEKIPVLVMVKTFEEFEIIADRIEGKLDD